MQYGLFHPNMRTRTEGTPTPSYIKALPRHDGRKTAFNSKAYNEACYLAGYRYENLVPVARLEAVGGCGGTDVAADCSLRCQRLLPSVRYRLLSVLLIRLSL